MRKTQLLIMMLILMVATCSSKKIESPILGKYEFGLAVPEKTPFGGMVIFNSDGTVDGISESTNTKEERIFTFKVNNDTILTLSRSLKGDSIKTSFVILSQSSDSTYLKLKSRVRISRGDAPFGAKDNITAFPVVEYDENMDSIPIIFYLKSK